MGEGVAADSRGNTYLGTKLADATIYVAKFDPTGSTVWEDRINSVSSNGAGGNAVAIRETADTRGNPVVEVYVTGSYIGATDFDPGPGTFVLTSKNSSGNPAYLNGDNGDAFVLKLGGDGTFRWARSLGGNGRDDGEAITVDAQGAVYTSGYFTGSGDFDPGTGTSTLTSASGTFGKGVYISKLDAAGNFVWAATVGGSTEGQGLGIALDGAGNVIVAGLYNGSGDFDPTKNGKRILPSYGRRDIFVLKLTQ